MGQATWKTYGWETDDDSIAGYRISYWARVDLNPSVPAIQWFPCNKKPATGTKCWVRNNDGGRGEATWTERGWMAEGPEADTVVMVKHWAPKPIQPADVDYATSKNNISGEKAWDLSPGEDTGI